MVTFVTVQKREANYNVAFARLVLDETAFGSDLCSLAGAVAYSYKTPDIDMESELYLNNAGGGGK